MVVLLVKRNQAGWSIHALSDAVRRRNTHRRHDHSTDFAKEIKRTDAKHRQTHQISTDLPFSYALLFRLVFGYDSKSTKAPTSFKEPDGASSYFPGPPQKPPLSLTHPAPQVLSYVGVLLSVGGHGSVEDLGRDSIARVVHSTYFGLCTSCSACRNCCAMQHPNVRSASLGWHGFARSLVLRSFCRKRGSV